MLRRSLERSQQLELKKRYSWGGATASPAVWGGASPAVWGGASPAVIVGPGGFEGEFRAVPALRGPQGWREIVGTACRGRGMLGTNLQVPSPDVMFQTATLPVHVFLVKGICVLLLAGSS